MNTIAINVNTNIRDVLDALADLHRDYPEATVAALRMESVNIQRSIAATIRGLRIKKYKFAGTSEAGREQWQARQLAKLDPRAAATRRYRGPATPGGVLGLNQSISVRVGRDMIEIGHKPKLEAWILRWQNGVPQLPRSTPDERRRNWYGYLLPFLAHVYYGHPIDTDEERRQVMDSIPERSADRSFYDDLAEITLRDFPRGLVAVLDKICKGRLNKANKTRRGA